MFSKHNINDEHSSVEIYLSCYSVVDETIRIVLAIVSKPVAL